MAIHWYDTDKITPISFPFNLGAFCSGESPNKLLWFYSDNTIEDFNIEIEPTDDEGWKAFQIADDFFTRPQAFRDYLGKLHWDVFPANRMTALWIKFIADKLPVAELSYSANLRFTGEMIG